MSQRLLYALALAIVSAAAIGWSAGCSSDSGAGNPQGPDAGNGSDAKSPEAPDSSVKKGDGGSSSDGGAAEAASFTYVLIDDMETTTHGPIELAGVSPPLTPGYWFNFGAAKADAGDMATPPILAFMFTALASPTTTYNGAMSAHAAHQFCALTGQYDVCGLGFEFAQVTDPDAGIGGGAGAPNDAASGASDAPSARDAASADASVQNTGSDGGDAGPPIPKITVPFDISQYKGIVFWAKTAGDAGTLDLKVQFPDTDTDPRGGVCNGVAAGASGPNDTFACYNSYAVHEMITGDWQEYTLLFTDLAIDPTFGFQMPAPWDGKKVYGINWQAQKNSVADGGVETEDFWVDDVYFIK